MHSGSHLVVSFPANSAALKTVDYRNPSQSSTEDFKTDEIELSIEFRKVVSV